MYLELITNQNVKLPKGIKYICVHIHKESNQTKKKEKERERNMLEMFHRLGFNSHRHSDRRMLTIYAPFVLLSRNAGIADNLHHKIYKNLKFYIKHMSRVTTKPT
jgi:hypothetical protein